MKIGYPCINTFLGCCANKTFRLRSYSPKKFIETVNLNLEALLEILIFNKLNNLLFFRISSCIIPFASHPILTVNWQDYFKDKLETIGKFINENNIRISMHPDQFIVINSPDQQIVDNSIRELTYHANFLNSLNLNNTHKIQIHIGGAYNNKPSAIERFVNSYESFNLDLKKRLVIENDDKIYSLQDCLYINKLTSIPILFDVLHHQCLNNNETIIEALTSAISTWNNEDGIAMIDYSNQASEGRPGKHSQTLDIKQFTNFLKETSNLNFDIMLEVKDKQKSALEALTIARKLNLINY